ncbi:erythromycin esterase [Pseudonocardia sediminis]|uniref:Erythromycin esterase n=1 Tax=Pseudonocardia sediminis TaxID=1397368 RepID=A0A4Q7V1D3_PSEST|nr:DUF6194 family protein [Pseudonocardia sediminis]RZT88126.1 erythromycin esterase [Pseudonocardia sediminis]
MTSSFPAPNRVPSFGFDDDTALAAALDALLDPTPDLLALGEPTHGEPALPTMRNRLFALLAERGFGSIALETDAVAALEVDAYVRGGTGTLDAVMASGFTHGFGELPANRELVAWMRAHNDTLPPARRLAFHGVDAPTEADLIPSPRPYLTHLHRYLFDHLDPAELPRDAATREQGGLDRLLGDDDRWSDRAALYDAAVSIGGSPEARALRVLTDDLMTALHTGAPRLVAATSPEDWHAAAVHGRSALGLLRIHAHAADPGRGPGERLSRLLGIRSALMAEHLHAVRARERHRGPTFVFAQNAHLLRHPARWAIPGMDVEWSGAGAIVAAVGVERCTVVAGSLGASSVNGLPAPAPSTFEGALERVAGGSALLPTSQVPRDGLHTRTDASGDRGYAPLSAENLDHADAVLHVATSPGAPLTTTAPPTDADLAARILRDLPGITHLRVGEDHEAAAHSMGDWFFSVDGARMPFATIVVHDTPGFDERSALHRPGVFRLNIGVGREEFEALFGTPPAELEQCRPDVSVLDRIVPHPAYGRQGWVAVLNPTDATLPEIDRLLALAHGRRSPQ